MAYDPTNWEDFPSIKTQITAAKLNKIENGIAANNNIYSQLTLSSKITDVDYKDVLKSGNVVTVYARFYVNQQIDNTEAWATLPYLPANSFAIDLKKGRYEFTGDKFEYTSHTDGVLKGNSLEQGWYQCNFVYITKA